MKAPEFTPHRLLAYNSAMKLSLRRAVLWGALPLLLVTLAQAAPAGQNDSRKDESVRRGRKYKPPPETARIEVTVVRASTGKPIPNAAVVFHPMEGERDKGNLELKTNEDGKAVMDVLPIGDTLRLQVIANGFQTYGEDYKVETAEKQILVKMKRPTEQYSIYRDNNGAEAARPHEGETGSGNQPKDQSQGTTQDQSKTPPPAEPQPK